jgi:SAM-dependent methyltransferase
MSKFGSNKILRNWYEPKNFNAIYYSGFNNFLSSRWHKLLEKGRNGTYKTILEVAATSGQHYKFVKHSFETYFITDLNLNSEILLLESIDNRIVVLEQDATTLNLIQSDSIDRMISTCLLHHLESPELVIQQFSRVCRKNNNSIFDIFVPNDGTLLWNLGRLIFIFPVARIRGWKWSDYWSYVKTDHIRSTNSVIKIVKEQAQKLNLKYEVFPRIIPIQSMRVYFRITLVSQ